MTRMLGGLLLASYVVFAGQPGPLVSPMSSSRDWPPSFHADEPEIPPALTPAEELKTFHMPPGYQVQLVAAEPVVQDPILAEFDGNGRLWVLELPAFSQGEQMVDSLQPINDLVILEDTDHDGIYDRRTVFMDKLIMPRAFKILDHNCALVGEPPNLWKACDTNGDLKADTKEPLYNSFARQGVIEHGANGLFWAMDNSIRVSEHTWELEYQDGKFVQVPNLSRGQWGITQDDGGRTYRNFNTDPLFVDYLPAKYYVRNPDLLRTKGLYESLVDQDHTQVWPVHPTLGVNRGYRPQVARENGAAYYYQGVSSPMIYRDSVLPELTGQAFVVDSPTNLVHLLKLTSRNGKLAAADFYNKGEFLASSDVRFRPVSMTPGWDGSFLIIDMYRGITQDPPIQTAYLRDYVTHHKLWDTASQGRIYRVINTGMKPSNPRPQMLDESASQLVSHLSSAGGWWRDTAQQLLVQRADKSVVPALNALVLSAPDWRTRLQALWTLDGLGATDQKTIIRALDDKSEDVRAAAVRIAERWWGADAGPLRSAMASRVDDPSWLVRRQFAASLGVLPAEARIAGVVAVLTKYGADPVTVDAAISGIKGQEADVLARLLVKPPPDVDAVTMLAGAVAKGRDAAAIEKLLAVATGSAPAKVRQAVLSGVGAGLNGALPEDVGGAVAAGRAGGGVPGVNTQRGGGPAFRIAAEPKELTALASGKGNIAAVAQQVLAALTWPGKPTPPVVTITRTPAEQALYDAGQNVYAAACLGCHQPEGKGGPHIAANLVGSAVVRGSPEMLVAVLVAGKEGPIGVMPPMGLSLNDQQLAAVLTYVRGNWNNNAAPIVPDAVKEYRNLYAYRKTPWTDEEIAARGRGGGAPPRRN